MKTSYELFSKYKEDKFENLKSDYLEAVKKARNQKQVSIDFQDNLIRNLYKQIQTQLGNHHNVIILIKDQLERDENKSFEQEFNKISKSFQAKEKKKIIQLLAELDAMNEFFDFWNNRELNSKKELHNDKKEKIIWKGKNQTEFVQLVYMLFDSNLITNESNLITKLVPEMAELLNFELTKSWKNDMSSNIHKTNNDYVPPIIKKLKKAYDEHKDKKIEKKRKN